jgi:hypothetical protein
MKKTFLSIALLSGILFCSNAQISTSSLQNATKKATAVATAAGYDVSSLKTSIMSKLSSTT